jgi:hypothetical protein
MRRALLIASLLVPSWHHVASACDDDDNDAAEAAEPDDADEGEAEPPEQPADTALEARVDELEQRVASLEQERGTGDDTTCDGDGDLDLDVDIDLD